MVLFQLWRSTWKLQSQVVGQCFQLLYIVFSDFLVNVWCVWLLYYALPVPSMWQKRLDGNSHTIKLTPRVNFFFQFFRAFFFKHFKMMIYSIYKHMSSTLKGISCLPFVTKVICYSSLMQKGRVYYENYRALL